MNTAEAIKAAVQSALDSIHAVESDLGWTDDSQSAIRQLNEALSALAASAEQQPVLTEEVVTEAIRTWFPDRSYQAPFFARYLLTVHSAPQASQPVAPEVAVSALTDEQREKVCEAVAEALGEAYDCTRVWSAWSYNTMGPDDFALVAEDDSRVAEIADAAIKALLSAASPSSEAEIRRKALESLRDAVTEAANEWAGYVEVDTAPRTCAAHIGQAFDKAASALAQQEQQAPAVQEEITIGGNGLFAGCKVTVDPTLPPDTVEMRGENRVRWNVKTGEITKFAASHPAPAQTGEKE